MYVDNQHDTYNKAGAERHLSTVVNLLDTELDDGVIILRLFTKTPTQINHLQKINVSMLTSSKHNKITIGNATTYCVAIYQNLKKGTPKGKGKGRQFV